MRISFILNGKKRETGVDPGEKLLDLLRRLGCKGVKSGCRKGECGSCTVIVDGKPVRSCLIFAPQVDGKEIWTVEGVDHPVKDALLEEGAVQCGFCIPGIVMTVKALLDEKSTPTDEDIKDALKGNLCRCTGYIQQIEAVKRVVKKS